jgi:predicted nucleic acid-binding protein
VKLLIDTNVVLDLLLKREPWAGEAARLFAAVESGRAVGYVAAHTVTTVHYLLGRSRDRTVASMGVSDLLRIVDVVPVERADLLQALALGFDDFEDGVQAICALKVEVDAVVTRDSSGFDAVSLAAAPPGVILAQLG